MKNTQPTQNQSEQSQNLKLELQEAMELNNLYHSPEFQNRLLPKLKGELQQVWLDPLKFKDKDEFYRTYEYARAKASYCSELIAFLQRQEQRVAELQKRLDEPDKNYEI